MSGRIELWGEELHDDRLEWELDRDPGKILDDWREASALLDSVAKLAEHSPNNAYVIATTDAHWRANQEVIFWEDQVRMRLEWNIKEQRLTAFGEVLKLLMERAGIESERELLKRAGKLGEMYAEETLLRHMYGPRATTAAAHANYLEGFDTALGLGDDEQGYIDRTRLAHALMWGTHMKPAKTPENGGAASA